MKALALVALLTIGASAPTFAPANTQSGIPAEEHPEVVRVDCLTGAGTAFRVGPNTLLSVNHVTSLGGCFIGGKPFTVKLHEGDFSILTMDQPASEWLKIDCGGFVANRRYEAIGYARGLDTLTEVDIHATGASADGFAILQGVFNVIPGQSGGPIVDPDTNKVVGTVNTFDAEDGLSGSVPLKDTPVCKGAA
jgi:hypothetical protein